MPPLFREKPPQDLVNRCVQTFGLTGLGDASWFSKEHIQLEQLAELFLELEPYYLPCKAAEFLHPPLTPTRAITVLRHLLRVYNAQLLSVEKARGGAKILWYQINAKEQIVNMEVRFD